MHYYDVADAAIRRGYSSNRDSSLDSMRRSFLDTLRRNDEEFTLLGRGHYKLTRAPTEELEEMAASLRKKEQDAAAV
jgi:hypothetical protein